MKSYPSLNNYFFMPVFLAVLGTVWCTSVFADCELAKLLASEGAASDSFGFSVGISGDVAVIGTYQDDDNGDYSGSAYIFRFNGSSWIQEAKLLASDGAEFDFFGRSVGIWGDTAIIGADQDDDNGITSGSAYIFRFNGSTWVEEAKLLASDGAEFEVFGSSVGIWGDTAVIGAELDDDNGNNSGSAYIFRFNDSNWVQETKLLASDGAVGDWFGCSVGICGDKAVIGAFYDDDNGSESGSAYIFRFTDSNWVQETKLLTSDGVDYDYFGCSVGIWGDTAVIGARQDDDNGTNSGSAYIFRFSGSSWVQETKLLASDGATLDYFGGSVGIWGDTAVIGAYGDDDNESESGSAYVFRFDGSSWAEEAKLLASDGAEDDTFGCSVGISGDTIITGANHDDDNGTDSGSAYIFGLDGATWEAKLLASDGAKDDVFGISVDISGDTAVIGAEGNDENGSYSGAAYIFRFNDSGWAQEAKLLASDGATLDLFGNSVGIWGDTTIIGSYWDDDNGNRSGSAYIFRFNGSSWAEETKLIASDGEEDDDFGISVCISGDTAVIGAYTDDDNGDNSGSAYIFCFIDSNWVQEAKLLASDGAAGDRFGNSVGISGDTVVIGAVYDDDNGGGSGSAYIFRFTDSNWVQETKLLAFDGDANDRFGGSVGIWGDTAVISAYTDDDNGSDSGSAYIFRFTDSNWVQEAKLLASDGAAGDVFGRSVGIWGDTAVVGAFYDDDSGSAYIFRFNGSSWLQETKLLAADAAEDDDFGISVGISGDTAVIGAFYDDDKGDRSGSAYIFGLNLNPGDLDFDNDVDFDDFCLFAAYWLETDCGPCNCDRADCTGDGQVDKYDLKELCNNWLAGK